MKISLFQYELPPESIATQPVRPRDHSRLFVLHRSTGEIEDTYFYNLPRYLKPGDVIVLNDTRVVPCILRGERGNGGGQIEIMLVSRKSASRWDCMLTANRRYGLNPGEILRFGDGELEGTVIEPNGWGTGFLVEFRSQKGTVDEAIDKLGRMFLPLYLPQRLEDPEMYQTVYAKHRGSVQPPVAGMHFTPELLDRIRSMGVHVVYITLHVGRLDGFSYNQYLRTQRDIEEHKMYPEYYKVPEKTAETINTCRARGGRVFAIGTTVARTLETVVDSDGMIHAGEGWTNLYIYPGHQWRAVDVLASNLQPPMSTHLILACAFAGTEKVLELHREAVRRGGRFCEFGDCALYL